METEPLTPVVEETQSMLRETSWMVAYGWLPLPACPSSCKHSKLPPRATSRLRCLYTIKHRPERTYSALSLYRSSMYRCQAIPVKFPLHQACESACKRFCIYRSISAVYKGRYRQTPLSMSAMHASRTPPGAQPLAPLHASASCNSQQLCEPWLVYQTRTGSWRWPLSLPISRSDVADFCSSGTRSLEELLTAQTASACTEDSRLPRLQTRRI